MAPSSKKDDAPALPPMSSTVILMLTIADTTWRLFVPSIGLTVIGVALDKHLGTKPWLMIGGIVLGATIAFLLVRMQMKKVNTV